MPKLTILACFSSLMINSSASSPTLLISANFGCATVVYVSIYVAFSFQAGIEPNNHAQLVNPTTPININAAACHTVHVHLYFLFLNLNSIMFCLLCIKYCVKPYSVILRYQFPRKNVAVTFVYNVLIKHFDKPF